MKVLCAWCREEGEPAMIQERAPLGDERPTCGVCAWHGRGLLTLSYLRTPALPWL